MKRSTHNQYESIDKQSYKRRYLERLLEEEDAREQIRNFQATEMSHSSSVDEERDVRDVPVRERYKA